MSSARSSRARRGLLLGPALSWWIVLLVVPVGLILAYSLFRRGTYGGVVYELNLDNFERLFDPIYLDVVWFSVRVAVEATAVSLLIGYPAAWFIATRPRKWRTVLLVVVVLPFWTSLLIRTYAWMVLLNDQGLVNEALTGIGIVDEPVKLLYNEFSIVLGLVYGYLPLMILPLYAAIERLSPELREAATDLGASGWRAFLTVTLPLTRTGVVAGCLFVFVPSLGNFIVPDLLGGGRQSMVGNLIQVQFLKARDWPFGATLALAVIALMTIVLVVQARTMARDRREGVADA
ncbi:MAG TPA: ABC transporter permease [Capillimicrobium sp.]|nr:ABC transporter permease [Capillimicrobium sp.]